VAVQAAALELQMQTMLETAALLAAAAVAVIVIVEVAQELLASAMQIHLSKQLHKQEHLIQIQAAFIIILGLEQGVSLSNGTFCGTRREQHS
jgi:hypothetical protein